MKINGKEYLSPQEQLFENTKDIEELKQIIKPVYQTTATLTSSSVSVALTDTNVEDATEGWLMTNDGLLFKITANDGTTVLLIYYADLKGPQGETGPSGAEVQIDDTGTSATKVWSSQKTSDKIDLISDKGIYYTTVQPTLDNGVYLLDVSDLGNNNTYTWQKYGDLIIYVDGNDNPTELWKCVGLNGTHDVMTVEKVAEFGGGKQLYQHNITITSNYYNGSGLYNITANITIFNDSNTQFTKETLKQWLIDKNFSTYTLNYGLITGSVSASGAGSSYAICGIGASSTDATNIIRVFYMMAVDQNPQAKVDYDMNAIQYFTDTVLEI